jgi:hypothetical protein
VAAERAVDILESPAGRRIRRGVAAGLIVAAPLITRHRIFRMTPLRLLGMAGGAALVVKAAEYIRDWERDQAYRTVVVTRGADGSRVTVRAPRSRG